MNYKIIFVLLITSTIFSQNLNSSLFTVIENPTVSVNNDSIDYFPLSDGDFWEYIERDTVQISTRLYDLDFSLAKEVIGDTLMDNGLLYKIVKWEHCANSRDKEPWYEYLRKDSINNVHIYYNNEDWLLFDFTLEELEDYPSHYEGYHWLIDDKKVVEINGEELAATDFQLYDENWHEVYEVTIVEDFGLLIYERNELEPDRRGGYFWGGVIGGNTYGELLARKQEIDWSEFYPLHIGDFWKYRGKNGAINTESFQKVIGDTVLEDGNVYQVRYSKIGIGGSYSDTTLYFERIDSNGNLYIWSNLQQKALKTVRFSSCLGDTTHIKDNGESFRRLDEKSFSTLKYLLYPGLVFSSRTYQEGVGLISSAVEGSSSSLVGYVINGNAYGDTTGAYVVTDVESEVHSIDDTYSLSQNYPNPFNPKTTIEYSIADHTKVTLKVYDLLGCEVVTLINEEKSPGNYRVVFNAEGLSSGIYIYTLKVNQHSISKKLTLIK